MVSGRVRRAWVIPPISVSENHKRLPYPLVQVRGRGASQAQQRLGCPHWVPGGVGCRTGTRSGLRVWLPPPQLGEGRPGRGEEPWPLGAPPPACFLPSQIKSDKQPLGSVIYSIQGPGVDEEPQGVFSIDKFTGKVFLNAMLDREKTDRFRVGPTGGRGAGSWEPPSPRLLS